VQTLFANARVTTLDPQHHNARCLLIQDDTIERVLDARPTGLSGSLRVVDCAGASIVPGLHDCHVHLTATGLYAGDRDLSDCRDVPSLLARIGMLARKDEMVFAGGFDDTATTDHRAPSRNELDAVSGGRPVLISRIDGHSSIANSAAFEAMGIDTSAPGVEKDAAGAPTGKLSGSMHWTVQPAYVKALPAKLHRRADRAAAEAALAAGITTLHNIIIGDAPYEELAEIYIDNSVLPLHVISKTCTTSINKAKQLGRRVFGGDIFVDGSLGSRTAALAEDYHDAAGRGLLYLTREQLVELFFEAAEAGLSPGVHAIGDDAIEQAIAAWEKVAVKRASLEGLRPWIDHFELARPDHIRRAARLGILLSMQPAFDHLWGGDGGMYEQRLGSARAKGMNLFREAKRSGCTICCGSDSPVTRLSALLGIHAMVNHHVEHERFSVDEALRCYTCDAALLSFSENRCGRLSPGMAADFTVLEKPLESLPSDAIKNARVLMTVVDGDIRHSAM
jgi:predicted amidohydrolase YtcJ